MRTLLFVMGLYLVHRVLLSISPAYAQRMRRLDRQLTWMSLILVYTFGQCVAAIVVLYTLIKGVRLSHERPNIRHDPTRQYR